MYHRPSKKKSAGCGDGLAAGARNRGGVARSDITVASIMSQHA